MNFEKIINEDQKYFEYADNINPEDFKKLCEDLKTNTSIKTLYLNETFNNPHLLEHLYEVLKVNKTITAIYLFNN